MTPVEWEFFTNTAATLAKNMTALRRGAAGILHAYLTALEQNQEAWGTRLAPNEIIRSLQVALGVTGDGIYGPETRRAASQAFAELAFPVRTPKPAPRKVS